MNIKCLLLENVTETHILLTGLQKLQTLLKFISCNIVEFELLRLATKSFTFKKKKTIKN